MSDEDDDDRNHKHRRRGTQDHSAERDQILQVLNRPYKKHNDSFQNNMLRESAVISHYNLDHDLSSKFDKRRQMGNYFQAFSEADFRSELKQSFPGESSPVRGRAGDGSWFQRESRFGSVDGSPLMGGGHGPGSSATFAGTGLAHVSNSQIPAWNNFGLLPGIANGVGDEINSLGGQGALQSTLNPSMNLGIPVPLRQQCRDFEERGFCLRGEMCPMEHGVNRIVIEDVQSLSQFNLPVSLPSASLLEMPIGAGFIPTIPAATNTMINRKGAHQNDKHRADEMFRLNGVPEAIDASSTDVYDPDQPLWDSDNSQSLVGDEPSDHLVGSNGAATGLQNRVWGRIHTSKHSADLEEKADSRINCSAIPESKMREVQVAGSSAKGASLSGKRFNSEESAHTVHDSSSKARDDTGRHIKRSAQKAQRTLYLNFIPPKDNKREALLAHFRKFGEVIDIYIPSNSERAFVQFSRREEAEATLKAPDAVMGNRFIRMCWANRDSIPDAPISSETCSCVVTQNVSTVTVPPSSTSSKRKYNLSVSIPKINVTQAAESSPGNGSKAVLTNGQKSSPSLQKKLQSLELLEEIRRKQEQLDQKRNEFRQQLDKLEKQASGIKGEVPSEQACKRLKLGIAGATMKYRTPRSAEPATAWVTNMAHESVLEPQTSEKSLSGDVQLDSASPTLPESPSLKNANNALTTVVVDVPGTKHHVDTVRTTFAVHSPLPSDLADVVALKGHFSLFGGLSNVELVNSEAEDDNHNSSDPKTIDKCSALVRFTSRRAAVIAFRDRKHRNGHDLEPVRVHYCSGGTSPDHREHRDEQVQPDTAGNLIYTGANTSSTEANVLDERREAPPSLRYSPCSVSHQFAVKSNCSEALEENTTAGAFEEEEEEESYIELEADEDSESSPVGISVGRQMQEGELC